MRLTLRCQLIASDDRDADTGEGNRRLCASTLALYVTRPAVIGTAIGRHLNETTTRPEMARMATVRVSFMSLAGRRMRNRNAPALTRSQVALRFAAIAFVR